MVNIAVQDTAVERVLGIEWCIHSDCFRFKITLKHRPLTRRGILSAVGQIYDPIGFIAPVILRGRRILQDVCKLKLDWDDTLPEEIQRRWIDWQDQLHELEELTIPRCFKPAKFGSVVSAQLHTFSDASTTG